ncbi:MAG: ABC transporter substrate-binding protein [Lachnospiraceae bacterium]|nr:ABC transporter substrate-binding protein [Lachnospiraceae bacterium]
MQKNKYNIIAILILAFALAGCGNGKEDTIKIGSIHPLTGNMAYEGQAMVNSQKIAIDEINANGGINGKKLELVTVDSMGTSSGAANAALKLANSGVVALTGTYTSSSAQIVSRSAEKNKIPFVVTVASSDTLLSNGYKYTFRIQPSTTAFSEDFLEYIDFVKTEDMKTVAFVYENSNYGTGIAEYINSHIEQTGLEVVGMISYPATASTLSSEVTRLAALDPDLLVPIGYYSDQSLLMKEILERDIRFDTILGVANGAFSDAKFTATYGTRVDGIYDINYRYNPNSEEAQHLLNEYYDRYGEEIPVAAIYGYQSVMVVADALKRARDITPNALRDALADTKMDSHILPQGAIEFDDTGENIRSAGVLIRVKDAKQVVVFPKEYAEISEEEAKEEDK